MKNGFFIGCDVGTTSVRAGIFDASGVMIAARTHPIQIWRPENQFVEQSSQDIWEACCRCFTGVLAEADLEPDRIRGVGFDATCSLVVLGEDDRPLPVSPSHTGEQNVIVWMDHRAVSEAAQINQSGHEVLRYTGGSISPEMQTPKLLWLKNNMPQTWSKAEKFFDLPDYLVYRSTGEDVRSLCTTTCKWTYSGHLGKWEDDFFRQIGLGSLVDSGYRQIGNRIRPAGEPVGSGLHEQAARDLGLPVNTPVGVAIIDAHAGGIGLMGMQPDDRSFNDRFALIGGTSSCHMAVSAEPRFINGIWGPYHSAMIPEMWLNEGGQSATGSLIDHMIFSSARSDELQEQAQNEGNSVYQVLNERLHRLARKQGLTSPALLTRDLHVLPYFHGNRSPRANPGLTGSICGLHLSSTLDDLALTYLATIQSIAYGTRHIIEELNNHGYSIDTIMATGGGTKNEVFLQEHAHITGCRLVLPAESEAVLLGSAILGSVASGAYASVEKAMQAMNRSGRIIEPVGGSVKHYHGGKYRVFRKMHDDQLSYNEIMSQ